MTSNWQSWAAFAISVVVMAAAVFVLSWIASVVVRTTARRGDWGSILVDRVRWPFRTVLMVAGLWIAVAVSFQDEPWRPVVDHVFLIALIGTSAWLTCQAFLFLTDLGERRYDIDVADNRIARRARTQLQIVRRLVVVVIVVLALGIILFTFDGVRALGASVLASAGIASIVAGLAAQSVLANVFAGVQIAFSEAIRVDDVVVVDDEWGRIREITLTYVVVVTWDERTIVLPCTYFTTQPFENWTKYGSALIGSVEFDLDWRVSTDGMRTELDRVLAGTDLWDGRTSVLQVTDATAGQVRVRVLVSAKDSAALWDLRCAVREELVEWVREHDDSALPVERVLVGAPQSRSSEPPERVSAAERREPAPSTATDASRGGLFSGSRDAEERASEFTQAVPVQDVGPGGDQAEDERYLGKGGDA
jgi:small-conductance mechanosensitive channel